MNDEDLTELETRLSDRLWRLTSGMIYKIKTADGQGVIPFTPRPEQVELLRELLAAVGSVKAGKPKETRKVKLKARRLGFSTAIGVFVADCLAFRRSFTAVLIDQTADDATKKMNGIVKVALDSVREVWPMKVLKSNDSELTVDLAEDCDGSGASSFFAGTKSRGGSTDLLWPSELGVIQFDDPKRSEEIVSGAFPSARHGVICVETTWKGGKGGHLWDIIKPTLEGKADDWSVSFSPWWQDPRNVSDMAMHDAESLAYFAGIEERLSKDRISISDSQRRWYAAERRTLGIFMKRENPTFLDECWTAPIEGSIYASSIERARTEQRVCPFAADGNTLVNTSWDLGAPANTVVWYWQVVGRELRIVDCDMGFEGTIAQRANYMKSKGYVFGKHFLPHDAGQTSRSGVSLATELAAKQQDGAPLLGNVVIVPRCHSEWVGINHLIGMFSGLAFRSPACDAGLDVLACFHVHKDGASQGEPKHDWSSHVADALRTMAEAQLHGLFKFSAAESVTKPDWFGQIRKDRRGARPRVISGLRV